MRRNKPFPAPRFASNPAMALSQTNPPRFQQLLVSLETTDLLRLIIIILSLLSFLRTIFIFLV